MNAWTPGPWHVGTKEAHHCVYDSHGWCIADASPMGKDKDTGNNARLISLAPEMAEALRRLVDMLDNMTTRRFSLGGDKDAREHARSLLARLEGGEK